MIKKQPDTIINRQPFIGYYRNFLSSEECDYIISNQDFDRLRYKVDANNNNVQDETFTNSLGRYLSMDEINHVNLFGKLKDTFELETAAQAEIFHLAKYPDGGHLTLHHDYRVNSSIETRRATFVLWLNDDFAGGEMHFPRLNLQVRPKKGCGIFFMYGPNFNNEIMIHESKVNTGGPKYMLPVFMRAPEFKETCVNQWKQRYKLESVEF